MNTLTKNNCVTFPKTHDSLMTDGSFLPVVFVVPHDVTIDGDVELNPGPDRNYSDPCFRPALSRYNCYRERDGTRARPYRYRSDPDNREEWLEQEIRNAEKMFHQVGGDDKIKLEAVVAAISAMASRVPDEGIVAQVFGLDVKDILGFGDIAASVNRAVDVAACQGAVVREEIASAFRSIPEILNSVLDSSAGFLPVTIRTVVLCACTLASLYVVRYLLRVSGEFFSLLYSMAKVTFSGCSAVFQCFDEWLAHKSSSLTHDINAQVGDADPSGVGSAATFAETWIPRVVPMCLSMFVAGAVKAVPAKDNSPDAWLRRMAILPRACEGFASIFTFVSTWFEKCVAYARELMYGPDPLAAERGIPAVTEWMDQVVELSKDLPSACRNRAGCERVKSLWYRGDRLLKEYRGLMDREMLENVKRMLQLAARMREQAINSFGRPQGVRSVPQLVWLVGESQIGKSTMQYFLAAELLAEFGMASDVEDQMYMRAVEQEYVDGYNGQYVWVMDDAFQMKDSQTSPNVEFFEIIRAVGNFPYALHMADLSQKANTYFASKSLICSTNNANLDIQSLTYPDAVLNRFAFAYKVRVKPEYQLVKMMHGQPVVTLDVEKARRDAPVVEGQKAGFNLNVYEFYKFNPCDPDRVDEGAPISFRELAQLLRADLRSRDKQSTGLSTMLKQYARRLDAGLIGDESDSIVAQGAGDDDFQSIVADDDTDVEEWRNYFDGKVIGEKTLGELRDKWQNATFSNTAWDSSDELDKIIICSELDQCDLDDNLKLKDVNWSEFMTPPEVMAKVFFFKPEPKLDAIHRKFTAVAEALRTRWASLVSGVKEAYERLIQPCVESFFKFLKSGYTNPMLVGAIVLCSTYLGCYYRDRMAKSKSDVEAESDTRAQQPRARPFARVTARKGFQSSKAKPGAPRNAQMAADEQQENVIRMVRQNQFLVSCTKMDGSWQFLGNSVVVSGSILMIPHHFVTSLGIYNASIVHLRRPDLKEGFDIPVSTFTSDVVWNSDHDIAFVNLHRIMPNRRRIVNHFASETRATRLFGTFQGALSGYRVNGEEFESVVLHGDITPEDGVDYGIGQERITVRNAYRYEIHTQKGDCGMLLTVSDPGSPAKLIGMHVAGSKNHSNWSVAVWRELIEEALTHFDVVAQMAGSFSHLEPAEMNVTGEFLPVGVLTDGPAELARSCIVPSSLHGKLTEPTTKPAHLKPFYRDGVRIDPLELGVKKAGKFIPIISEEALDVATRDVSLKIQYNYRRDPVPLEVLSYECAVAGIEGNDLFNGVSRVTSPGYPYINTLARGKGKTKWMGSEEYVFDTEDALKLRADVERLVDDAKNGRQLDVLWCDTLKDERRPNEKVDQGKTRVFSNGPMHFNIAFRQYFQAAFAHIQHNRIYNGIGVGLNVWSAEWETLYRHLTKFGTESVIDGDFGNFDGTLSAAALWRVLDIFNDLYDDGEENATVRRALWTVVVNATRYYRGQVYQCTHSVPSGVPGTSIIDSMALLILFRVVWMKLAPKRYRNMAAFDNHVSLITYGDDSVLNIAEEVLDWFNMETIAKAFGEIGMEFTDADKKSEIVRFKTIRDIQFLKRKFVWSPLLGRHTCPADFASRLESLNWTRKNNVIDTRIIEADTIQNVFMEIAAHCDRELFDEWARKILKAAREVNLPGVVNEGYVYYHVPAEERD